VSSRSHDSEQSPRRPWLRFVVVGYLKQEQTRSEQQSTIALRMTPFRSSSRANSGGLSGGLSDQRESYTHRSQRILYLFGQILVGDHVMDRPRGNDARQTASAEFA
jgi:hypothetical protein